MLPPPTLGAAYGSVLEFKVAVFKQFLQLKAEPTIMSSDFLRSNIRCRLRSDSTTAAIGVGKPCVYYIEATRQNSESDLCVVEVISTHSCPADVRRKRNSTDDSVGQVYTQPEVNANGRPIRQSAQNTHYIFAPSLRQPTGSSASGQAKPVAPKRAIAATAAPGEGTKLPKRARLTKQAKSPATGEAATWSGMESLHAIPSFATRTVPPAGIQPPAKPMRALPASTHMPYSRPHATSMALAPRLRAAGPEQTATILPFLATDSLNPAQRKVLASALVSAGVSSADDILKVLFLQKAVLTSFGAQLQPQADAWPSDERFRTIGEALFAVVEEARTAAGVKV
ncbi:hypothetical protein JCM10908_001172 [Rhodotorula pacifica]|uniref:uncharacterized protein n=1 Tax=Rhodotorula pacifica TaxID=1495444 RepID=UPI00317E9409